MSFYKYWELAGWKRFGSTYSPPRLLDVMKKYPNDFISFRDMPKIGLNPRPGSFTTPLGIFAFPVSYYLKYYHSASEEHSAFDDMPYIYIIRPRNVERMLQIRVEGDEAYELYRGIRQEALRAFLEKTSKVIPAGVITGKLRRLGYDGVIDWGTGVIHRSEEYQAVFFGEHTIRVLEMIRLST